MSIDPERSLLDYEVPRNLAEVFPHRIAAEEKVRKCSRCGKASQALPADQLWVIKHRDSSKEQGVMYLYCSDHLQHATEWREGGRTGAPGNVGDVCDVHHTTRSLTGVCDECG